MTLLLYFKIPWLYNQGGVSAFSAMVKTYLRAVVEHMILNVKNTQEICDNMGDVSGNDALKCVVVAKWVDEFNMDIFNTKDNTRPNSLNELLSCLI